MGRALASRDREERRLAKRLARRDPEALRELYALHGGATFGFLVRVLGDRSAAEDVQQQVFLEAWQRGERFDLQRGGLLTWLLRSPAPARSTICAGACPSRATRPWPSLWPIAPTSPQLDELLEHWRMAGELARLPDEEAELLRRRFYLGQSQTEIAAATGVPLGTVKSRMVSGLRRLRVALEDDR